MIIDREKKIIFCHVEKTAGSSITSAIWHHLLTENKHEPVNYPNKHAVMPEGFEDYFKFAFVRNPYDRAVSKYFHHRRIEGQFPPFEKSAKHLIFSRWVDQGGLRLFRPQSTFGLERSDFVGRFENLAEDVLKIANKIDVRIDLKHINKGLQKRKHFSKYYTPSSKSYVLDKYAKDFAQFDYPT